MGVRTLVEIYQFVWMLESNGQQRLAWQDAAQARIARARADQQAAAQLRAMLDANPSSQLGHSKLNDPENLWKSGLI